MNEARCYKCKLLKMEEAGIVPENWVSNKCYTCSEGRYAMGETYKQWFTWGGIIKPNKTVRTAQTDCPLFQQSL